MRAKRAGRPTAGLAPALLCLPPSLRAALLACPLADAGEPLEDTRLVPNHTLVAAIRAVVGDHACAARRVQ